MNKYPNSEEEEGDMSIKEINEEMLKFMNFNSQGLDEDIYVEGQTFEFVSRKMNNITDDGGVKKRVLREGQGETPASMALVKVDYNAYIEFEPTPFDSTYARRKSLKFVVNNGEVLLGLDLAVQSMKAGEKSQFLFSPTYAYGKMGCLGRIPANTQVLFEIELIEIIDSGAALKFQDLPENKKRSFEEIYKYCSATCAKAKDHFSGNNINSAIREYNGALHHLENALLDNYEEQEKQNAMLLKLYTNLVVCYTKINEPRKSCMNFNKLNALTKEMNVDVPVKALFNNAKSLKQLGEYNLARKRLEIARARDPNNVEISIELVNLDKTIREDFEKEKALAKKLMSGS